MTPVAWHLGRLATRRFRPRWYHAYVLLALLDLVTVCGSLYLNDRLARQSVRMIEADSAWAHIRNDLADLGQLALEVNGPGNDVFDSEDPAAEIAQLEAASQQLQRRTGEVRKSIERHAGLATVSPLMDDFEDFEHRNAAMVGTAREVIEVYGAGQLEEAGRRMALMDRQMQGIHAAITSAEARVHEIQSQLFERHRQAAQQLRRYEAVIAGLIGAMIVGAAWYGLRTLREQRRTEAALLAANAELEDRVAERTADLEAARQARDRLLQGLFTAQEDERRRISRELHDGIGQLLATLRMRMHAQSDTLTDEHCRVALEDMRRIVTDAITEVRQLSQGLRPSVLDDIGLIPALERLAADVNQTGLIQVRLSVVDPPADRLPEEVESAVYRIVQEAVTNALRHAAARNVSIELLHDAENVEVLVTDDGVGFAAAQRPSAAAGLGLSGMRERAELLHGALTVDSQPGRGTVIRAVIPCLGVSA